MDKNNLEQTFVFADIETDSLLVNKILQIGAVSGEEKFSIHINPKSDLPMTCTNLTGLYYHKSNLYKNGKLVPSVSVHKGLKSFKNWIQSFNKPVSLVFHNAFSFDMRVLMKQFLKFGIPFPENVTDIHDTLPSFRKKLKENEISDHKLSTLAEFTKVKLTPHDALEDSLALMQICNTFVKDRKIKLSDFLNQYKKPVDYFYKIEVEKRKKNGD